MPTVIAAPTYYVLHIVRDGVTFLACAKSEMPPLLGIEVSICSNIGILLTRALRCKRINGWSWSKPATNLFLRIFLFGQLLGKAMLDL